MTRTIWIGTALWLGACGPKTGATPTVGQIFAAHDDAVDSVQVSTLSMTMRTEMEAQGMTLISKMVMAMPDRIMSTTEIPGLGDLVTAYDGQTGWEIHPLMGSRILEGEALQELLQPLHEMNMESISEVYPSASLVGEEEFGAGKAWKLDATDTRGQQVTLWFDKESKVQVGKQALQRTDAGEMLVSTWMEDYRPTAVGLTPFRLVNDMGGMAMTTVLEEISAEGFELPDFAPPAQLVQGADEADETEDAPADETEDASAE
jgi:hypothetical protein